MVSSKKYWLSINSVRYIIIQTQFYYENKKNKNKSDHHSLLFVFQKINKDNAWNLQLIDFMSSMLRRHDARMENLQTASTVVDASARIYSFRVDAVHFDVLKMAGGLSKAAQVIFSQEMLKNGNILYANVPCWKL